MKHQHILLQHIQRVAWDVSSVELLVECGSIRDRPSFAAGPRESLPSA